MKNAVKIVAVVVAMLFSASFVFADVNVKAKGGDADARARAEAVAAANAKSKSQSQAEINNSTPLQAPLMGAIVGPGGAQIGKWEQLRCNPAYQSFTIEELKTMSDSGRLMDRRGSFWDIFFGEKERVVLRGKNGGQKTDRIKILNNVPPIGTKFLGNFACTGDVDWPLDEPLAKCLALAKEKTGANNVVVWKVDDIDATNSGTAVGAGTGMSNPFGDGSVGAGSLSASFGKTHSMKERVRLVEVHAYEDVIEASNVCGGQVNYYVPPPQARDCDPTEIIERIKKLERKLKKCTTWCMNNLGLREEAGNENIEAYICTGDKKYLLEAIKHYQMAENNYFKGPDVKSYKSEAKEIMAQVYYNWAGCIFELFGQDAAKKFAVEKHLERFPTGFAR